MLQQFVNRANKNLKMARFSLSCALLLASSSAASPFWSPPLRSEMLHPPHARARLRAKMGAWAQVSAPSVGGHVFSPIDFGADPSGVTDSTDAVAAAMSALLNASAPYGQHGDKWMRDAGDAALDLEGGMYLISAPLVVPPNFANLAITRGSLIASPSFPPDRFLIEVGGPTNDDGNIDVSLSGLFLDAFQVAAGGLRTTGLCGGVIGPQVYIFNFTGFGMQIRGGFEVTVMQSWAGEFWWGDPRKENGTASTAVGISKDGNDGDVNDVVVFSSHIGLAINGEANSVTQVHTWNLANGRGGTGILANVSQCRFTECYLDWNDIVFSSPSLVSFTGGIFLCGAHVRQLAPPSGVAHGVYLANNEFVGDYCGMGNPAVEAQGVFTSVSDVTVAGTLVDDRYSVRGPAATLVVRSATPTTTFTANFSGRLLFDTARVPIASVSYSLTIESGSALAAHAARPAEGDVVVIEVESPVVGSVTVTVDQNAAQSGPALVAASERAAAAQPAFPSATLPALVHSTKSFRGALALDPNPNCVSRGQCIPTYPKYPDQHTLCLASNDTKWHCAALAGVWGDADWSFGPQNTRDTTMMGGMGVDLNETFTAHALPSGSAYGTCNPSGAQQWEITRELSYLNGTVTGSCESRFFSAGREPLGTFEHPCAVLTQITLEADPQGKPRCVGCRCCTKCSGCACLPP